MTIDSYTRRKLRQKLGSRVQRRVATKNPTKDGRLNPVPRRALALLIVAELAKRAQA